MSNERSLWDMLLASLQRVKQSRVERKKQVEFTEKTFRHLLSVPYRGAEYQALIDQVMNHNPYDQPLIQKGKLVDVAKEERKYLES